MRIFVTGASGWIGSALVPELTRNGHPVLGLVRSDASAEAVADMGAEALRGDFPALPLLVRPNGYELAEQPVRSDARTVCRSPPASDRR